MATQPSITTCIHLGQLGKTLLPSHFVPYAINFPLQILTHTQSEPRSLSGQFPFGSDEDNDEADGEDNDDQGGARKTRKTARVEIPLPKNASKPVSSVVIVSGGRPERTKGISFLSIQSTPLSLKKLANSNVQCGQLATYVTG